MGSTRVIVVVAALAVLALPGTTLAQSSDISDTLAIVKDDVRPGYDEIAVELSEATGDEATRVLVARDDDYADALASGLLQGSAPLFLVPTEGPVPPTVVGEIQRLGAAEAILLGGPAALSPAVADELQGLGLTIQRRAGATRFATAVQIAQVDGSTASRAILTRAYPSPDASDPTQGFADALAAGGLAASEGWPVLLTNTDALSPVTRDHLIASGTTDVTVVGGPAAVSDAVVAELRALDIDVERLAGAGRADTAVRLAQARGVDSASQVDRVVLVDSRSPDAWVGGFAAAAHSARFNAPIVLSEGGTLPPVTATFLEGGAPEQVTEPVLTCVTDPDVCESARVVMGLPARASLTLDPPGGGEPLASGQTIRVTMLVPEAPAGTVTLGGTCLDEVSQHAVTAGEVVIEVVAGDTLPPGACTMTVSLPFGNGSLQRLSEVYNGTPGVVEDLLIAFTEDLIGGAEDLPGVDDPDAGVYLTDVAGGDRRLVFQCDQCSHPAVTPDGQAIVVIRRDPGGTEELVRLDAPGFDTPTVLAATQGSDGSEILVTSSGEHVVVDEGNTLVSHRLDGSGTPVTLAAERLYPVAGTAPAGPEGADRLLAHNGSQLVLLDPATGASTFVTDSEGGPSTLSPDGLHVGGEWPRFTDPPQILSLTGGTSQPVTDADGEPFGSAGSAPPVFAHDGRSFFFVRAGTLYGGDVADGVADRVLVDSVSLNASLPYRASPDDRFLLGFMDRGLQLIDLRSGQVVAIPSTSPDRNVRPVAAFVPVRG